MRRLTRPGFRWRVLGLVPLPLLATAVVGIGMAAPEPELSAPARWDAGWVDATAVLIPAMPMKDMISPMPMDHSPEVQIVLQLRNTTRTTTTVPFGDIQLRIDDSDAPAEPVAGVGGTRTIQPHAAVEERLRFRAPKGAERVRLTIPDGDDEITVGLRVRPLDPQAPPPGEPVEPHGGHGGHG